MGCAFCATGRLGFTRNLAAWEMVDAFLRVRDEAPGHVTGVVFQGQGEPLLNYDQVIRAAQVLSHPCGAKVGAPASASTRREERRQPSFVRSRDGLCPDARRGTHDDDR